MLAGWPSGQLTLWHGCSAAGSPGCTSPAAHPVALHLPAHPSAPHLPLAHPCRLKEEGLDSERWGAVAQSYISGQTRQTLNQAVAAIKAAKQEVTDRDARRTRITELFTQQGLQEFLPQQHAWGANWGGMGGERTACCGVVQVLWVLQVVLG